MYTLVETSLKDVQIKANEEKGGIRNGRGSYD